MRNTKIGLAALSAIAASGMAVAAFAEAAQPSRPAPSRRRARSSQPIGRYGLKRSGNHHYFTRCRRDHVSTSTGHTESCGKGCTRVRYSNNSTTVQP